MTNCMPNQQAVFPFGRDDWGSYAPATCVLANPGVLRMIAAVGVRQCCEHVGQACKPYLHACCVSRHPSEHSGRTKVCRRQGICGFT